MMELDSTKQIKEEIISLYLRYFGSQTADNYSNFYADKDIKIVLTSATELITEYAGESKSKEILGDIYKRYNIQPN